MDAFRGDDARPTFLVDWCCCCCSAAIKTSAGYAARLNVSSNVALMELFLSASVANSVESRRPCRIKQSSQIHLQVAGYPSGSTTVLPQIAYRAAQNKRGGSL
ncbi:hypothetical protein BCR33DRAFT_221122 [Rhizoclosmatium globosum]|uniref:Uncharacterized protein n=1 Tax=Rhizoclosmatium globosum TaxID=329046 RepID=A0A1Y2CC37_9FUNG|nr:hypothetical protein BCR33DRAFT_221122 [Rhizoclosmatium globosum]|eukprot:ORY44414.1 hypothetical protein BCR33DRAFT_221122 [Rhizoclosmatium globosum]